MINIRQNIQSCLNCENNKITPSIENNRAGGTIELATATLQPINATLQPIKEDLATATLQPLESDKSHQPPERVIAKPSPKKVSTKRSPGKSSPLILSSISGWNTVRSPSPFNMKSAINTDGRDSHMNYLFSSFP